jgi:hypothetical protein
LAIRAVYKLVYKLAEKYHRRKSPARTKPIALTNISLSSISQDDVANRGRLRPPHILPPGPQAGGSTDQPRTDPPLHNKKKSPARTKPSGAVSLGGGAQTPRKGTSVLKVAGSVSPTMRACQLTIDPALPPGMDAKKIQAGIELGLKQMTDRGWQADACLIQPDATAAPTVERRLGATTYDCVVIGAGVRLPPKNLLLFETIVNTVRKAAPNTSIAFNTVPEDTGEAAARWLSAANSSSSR